MQIAIADFLFDRLEVRLSARRRFFKASQLFLAASTFLMMQCGSNLLISLFNYQHID
jgi:hypothetical protein